jgi:hypothetical protein
LARLLLAALPDLRPDFPDERAFAMTAYATGGSRRRQPRRDPLSGPLLKVVAADFTLPAHDHDRSRRHDHRAR